MNEIKGSESSRGLNIQNISEKYSREPSGTWGAYVGEVAEKILNDEFLTIEDPTIFYFLDTLEDSIATRHLPEDLRHDRILILDEIASYVVKSAMYEDEEDQERYKRFFALDSELDGQQIKQRVTAAMDVVEALYKFGIKNSELNRKLFSEIYIDNGLKPLLDVKNKFRYTNEARDLFYFFHDSQFFYDEVNINMLQRFTYSKILEIYETFTESDLSNFDDDMVEISKEVLESGWFLDEEMEREILDNTKLQGKLIRACIATKKEWGDDKGTQTPLEVFEENIEGFKDSAEKVQRDELKDNMKSIFNIIWKGEKRFLSDIVTKDGESELYKAVKNIKNLYDDESGIFLKSLEEILDSKGVYVEDVISPILDNLINKLDDFYEVEERVWRDYIDTISRDILCVLGERVGNIDLEIEETVFKRIKKSILELRRKYLLREGFVIDNTNIEIVDEELMKLLGINDLKDINLRSFVELDRENLEEKFVKTEGDIDDIFNTYDTLKLLLSINGFEPK